MNANKFCPAIFAAVALACHPACAQQATSHDYDGTYGGFYRASQGLTRVVLVINAAGEGQVTARYVFYPDNSNHSVPSGEYLLEGTIDEKTGKLFLTAKRWVVQPKGYVMADVVCMLINDRRSLVGQIYLKDSKEVKFEINAERWSAMP